MHLSFQHERVLAVTAHPDDAELLCAGTLARAQRDGAEIGLCIFCRGDKGQSLRQVANLAAVRRKEMAAAAQLLNARLFRGNVADGTLHDSLPNRRKLVEVLRRFRPTLVLAHSPQDYHPDHRAASQLAEAATWFSASRGQATKSPPLEQPPALWWMDTVNRSGFDAGFYIDVSDFVAIKKQMLACHASQLQRSADRDFTPLLDLMRSQLAARGAEAGVPAAEAFRQHLAFKRARAW